MFPPAQRLEGASRKSDVWALPSSEREKAGRSLGGLALTSLSPLYSADAHPPGGALPLTGPVRAAFMRPAAEAGMLPGAPAAPGPLGKAAALSEASQVAIGKRVILSTECGHVNLAAGEEWGEEAVYTARE